MYLLVFFSFLAGIVTILSPCILPLLPLILSGGITTDKHRPLGIVLGFIGSFTLFTVALATLVKFTGISADALRTFSVVILIIFGLTLIFPFFKHWWELLASKLSFSSSSPNKTGFVGGLLLGISLGLLWTPCVGPILASVITLAASSVVTSSTVLITFAYSLGTAIPLFLIMRGSSWFMSRFTWLKKNSATIQQIFGGLMIVTALLIYFQLDRRFQIYILEKFPSYGAGLTSLEDTAQVQNKLDTLKSKGGNMTTNLKNYGVAPELTGGGEWLNSPPLTLASLKGQVVLLDFWTYSCINCIRTLPYLRAWHEKYSSKGLVIIGVHSPEFEFEKDLQNLAKAVHDFDLKYPIVQDNDFIIWRAYHNQYWPAKYLVDKDGLLRYTHFGEGKYDETERVIQELLGESSSLVDMPEFRHDTRSPETYLGYWRISNVASSPAIVPDQFTVYRSPTALPVNNIGFQGNWLVAEKYAEADASSSLHFRFDAKEVNLVMNPAKNSTAPTVTVLLDGQELKSFPVDEDKLYNLINLEKRGNHLLEIQFPEGGIEVYAFTFG